MIKKWSYVAAAMLTVASGLALTSCIDNDEPYGIEQIRLATASLLDAKKAALEAQQSSEQARIEVEKLKVQVEQAKAEAEKIKAQAEADYRAAEAEALKLEAQANAAKTQAEADAILAKAEISKARAEAIKKEVEAKCAEINQRVARAEQDAANAQRIADQKYAEAVYRFEKSKAENENKANGKLWCLVSAAFQNYLDKLNDFNDANENLSDELKKLAKVDLQWVADKDDAGKDIPGSGHFVSVNYNQKNSIEKNIITEQNNIDNYQRVIDIYTDFIKQIEDFTPGKGAQLLEEYNTLLKEAKENMQQAALEYEQVKIDQKDVLVDIPEQLTKELQDIKDSVINIKEYTLEPINVLAAVNYAWRNPIEIVPAGKDFTYAQVDAYNKGTGVEDNYTRYTTAYKNLITRFRVAMLDENDKVWSQAHLNEINRQLKNVEPLNNAIKLWELAKKVYATGDEPKQELLPFGADLKTAVEAYNNSLQEVADAKAKVEELEKVKDEAYKAYQNAVVDYNANEESVAGKWAAAQNTYSETLTKIFNEYTDAQAEADANYTLAIQQADLEKDKLWVAYLNKSNEQFKVDNDPKSTEAQKTAAATATQSAYDAYELYAFGKTVYKEDGVTIDEAKSKPATIDQKYAEARAAKTAAYDTAYYNYNKAEYAAKEAQNKAKEEYLKNGGAELAEKDPKYKDVTDADETYQQALTDWQDAKDAVTKLGTTKLQRAYDKMKDLADEQLEEIRKEYKDPTFDWDYLGAIPDWTYDVVDWYNYGTVDELPTAVAPIMLLNEDADNTNSAWLSQVYANARGFVIDASNAAYGVFGTDLNPEHNNPYYSWNEEHSLLIDNVTGEVIDKYLKKNWLMQFDDKWISPFAYMSKYNQFGLFGQQYYLLLKQKFAEACVDPQANNEIQKKIDVLTTNLEELENAYNHQVARVEEKDKELKDANDAADLLNNQALAACKTAQTIYNTYYAIVNKGVTNEESCVQIPGLIEWAKEEGLKVPYINENGNVDELSFDNSEGKEKAILQYQVLINKLTKSLDTAKEDLAKYQYQLAQYEAGYTDEDFTKDSIERLQKAVEEAQIALDFAYAHYKALQDKYDAQTKE